MRQAEATAQLIGESGLFPFLFGGTFIEAFRMSFDWWCVQNFPSFSEGLSLRQFLPPRFTSIPASFPFLFGGTFIEAYLMRGSPKNSSVFPFLFGGTFIEAPELHAASSEIYPIFPFLFGGTFIEAHALAFTFGAIAKFPFLFGGTFIEAFTL